MEVLQPKISATLEMRRFYIWQHLEFPCTLSRLHLASRMDFDRKLPIRYEIKSNLLPFAHHPFFRKHIINQTYERD
jgi:hypothetical protein